RVESDHEIEELVLEHIEIGRRAQASVDVSAPVDLHCSEEARYRAGGRHCVGQFCAWGACATERNTLPGLVVDRHRPVIRVWRPWPVADTSNGVLERLGRYEAEWQPAGQDRGRGVPVRARERGGRQPPRAGAERRG